MIKYPVKSVRAIGFLKRPYNDVEIYVEDTTTTNMYVLIFRKILGDASRLRSVTPVGDRTRVIKACRLDQAIDGRKKLYVIDGDFDHFVGRAKPALRHLYRLRAYSIENLLFDETAIISVGVEDDTMAGEEDIGKRLQMKPWMAETVAALLPMFIVYATAHELEPHVQTVGYTVVRLCNQTPKGLCVSRRKVKGRMREVIRAIRQKKTLSEYLRCRKEITNRIRKRKIRGEHLISGKNYILPLPISRLEKMVAHRGNAEQLKVRLARNFDPKVDAWLVRRIRQLGATAPRSVEQ